MVVVVVIVFNVSPTTKVINVYGGGATAYSHIRQTGEALDQNCKPWLTR